MVLRGEPVGAAPEGSMTQTEPERRADSVTLCPGIKVHFRVFVMVPELSANEVNQLTLPSQKLLSPNREKCSLCL